MFPAFKEWQAVVNALASGHQTLILRKGGIAEGRGGFRPRGEPFWLLPTGFHAQADKLIPAAAPFLPVAETPALATVTLTAWAELHHHTFLDDWESVTRLAPNHLWTETTVRERFDWTQPAGLHLLVLRVHRLETPVDFALTSAQAGCKSWVELPLDPTDLPSRPALDDATFATAIRDLLQP